MNATPDNPMPLYLRSQGVANLFGISLRTVGNWKRRRVIPHHKIGRMVLFRRDEIEAAIARFRVPAVTEPNWRARRQARGPGQKDGGAFQR